jgi:cytochrome c
MKMIAAALTTVLALLAAPAFAATPPKEAMPDWGTALPKANLQSGQQIAGQCAQCHDITSTKYNQFGPPLWNVVMRPRATAPGFKYSPPMASDHSPWSYDRLFVYLRSPQIVVPGTPMTFPGVRNAQNRINIIAYLRTLADTPAPIPPPAPNKKK